VYFHDDIKTHAHLQGDYSFLDIFSALNPPNEGATPVKPAALGFVLYPGRRAGLLNMLVP
jgi:hypothetical protein